jgi:glutamine cyclotransferase
MSGCSSEKELSADVKYSQPRVIAEYPHDASAFTQGLEFSNERLFESTGLFGESSIREISLKSGVILESEMLDPNLFGEGITFLDKNRILQLTWKSGKALVWELDPLELVDIWEYEGQGWGVCLSGDKRLVMSDGSDSLFFRDPETFEIIDSIRVTLKGEKIHNLNELECDGGKVWANVWQTDQIVGIDLSTGFVTDVLDLSKLPINRDSLNSGAVLNGVARMPDSNNFLISGKLWPKIFEVDFNNQ